MRFDEVEVSRLGEGGRCAAHSPASQQEHHGEAGDHPAHEAGGGRTHHAHAVNLQYQMALRHRSSRSSPGWKAYPIHCVLPWA